MADKTADKTAEPGRWVLVKMIHAAVERTEAEIAELKSHGLFVRDATGPDDSHPDPGPEPQTAPAAPAPSGQHAGKTPAAPDGGKPAS